MAIAVQVDLKGATLEQYDQLVQKMGFTPQGSGDPRMLFHWVTKTADGVRATDVWETREAFEKFAQEKIGPLSQAAGITSPPEVTFFEVHSYLKAG